MGIVSRGGGGAGSPVTAIEGRWGPSAGTPSSIANGATLDAGMLGDGTWEVVDPNGALQAVVDDGSTMRVVFDQSGATTQTMYGNALLSQPILRYKTAIFGDFEFTARLNNPASTASANTQVALFAGAGDTTNQCHAFVQQHGRWQTTNAKLFGWSPADSGTGNLYTGSLYARTDLVWVGIKRVEDVVYFGDGGTGASPSWTWTATKWDTAGGACKVGLMFYAGSASSEDYDFAQVTLDGFVYTKNPAGP
jgi:hypothetical protein